MKVPAGLAGLVLLGVALQMGGATSAAPGGVVSCPKLSEAAKLPERPAGGVLRGDIDGDGNRDRASIHFAHRAPVSCGFFLVVETRTRALSVRVPEWYKPPQDLAVSEWPFVEPFVALIVRLDAHRSQVVVAREHGAAVVTISLYGIVNGKLEPLEFPAPDLEKLFLFGTVGTGDTNVRCRRGGPLIELGRSPTSAVGKRWRFDRTVYRLVTGRFVIIGTAPRCRAPSTGCNALSEWGFDVKPFTGCVVARGRRL